MDDPGDEGRHAAAAAPVLLPRNSANASIETTVIGAVTGLMAAATIATCLRAYVRRIIVRRWGWDDWVAMIAYVRLSPCLLSRTSWRPLTEPSR